MDYKSKKTPLKNRPKIKMLKSRFGWDKHSELIVDMETEGELYFNDAFHRWSYVLKNEEGKEFSYIRKYSP